MNTQAPRTGVPVQPWQLERLSYAELLLLREALLRALAELPLGSGSSALIGAHTRLVRDELRRRAGPRAGFTQLRRAA